MNFTLHLPFSMILLSLISFPSYLALRICNFFVHIFLYHRSCPMSGSTIQMNDAQQSVDKNE
ncbi:hypothetical protein JHK82_056743 [Glycine max]|nr:hypothetical protein JHK84_056615 [Glycine max]KAG5078048.1 hypothetical protein JHK82_056743 [Glycine max]